MHRGSGNSFPQWLRREIEGRLLTFGEFADRAGVSRSTLDTWLAGKYQPRGVNVVRIARALGVEREQVDKHLPATVAA
jgi:transcriptional regulator with XRE-family HTH domain